MRCPRSFLEFVGVGIVPAISHRIPVPLGISKLAGNYGSKRRYRIRPPVNENSELRVAEPARYRALIDRVPGWFVSLRVERYEQRNSKQQQVHHPSHEISSRHQGKPQKPQDVYSLAAMSCDKSGTAPISTALFSSSAAQT